MTTTETHPQLEEVLRLRAQGMSVRAIAAAIGMSRAYVGQLVQGIGTRAPVARADQAEAEAARDKDLGRALDNA